MANSKKVRNRIKAMEDLMYAEKMFNDKIERLRREIPESIEYLPNYSDIKKMVNLDKAPTRELRALERSLQRFIEDKAEMPYTTEEGVTITVWEKEEIDREFDRINERREKERKRFTDPYQYIMNERRANLKERVNNVEKILPKNWDRWRSNLMKSYIYSNYEVKAAQYKENYLSAVELVFGKGSLYERVSQLKAEDLMEAWYKDHKMSIDFVYTIYDLGKLEDIIDTAITAANIRTENE